MYKLLVERKRPLLSHCSKYSHTIFIDIILKVTLNSLHNAKKK